MQIKSLPIILSILVLATGCPEPKPNAFICTIVVKDPLEDTYAVCDNSSTHEHKEVNIRDMHKWQATDPNSYERLRDYYKTVCP